LLPQLAERSGAPVERLRLQRPRVTEVAIERMQRAARVAGIELQAAQRDLRQQRLFGAWVFPLKLTVQLGRARQLGASPSAIGLRKELASAEHGARFFDASGWLELDRLARALS